MGENEYNIKIPRQLDRTLEDIAEDLGKTKSEVMGCCFALYIELYRKLQEASTPEGKIHVTYQDRNKETADIDIILY